MATKRGSRYYIDRTLKGVGRIHRSLGTGNAGRAEVLESMLTRLHGQGRLDLIRAFADGTLGIEQLADAYETQTIPQLTIQLARQDVRLRDAVERALRDKSADVRESTLARYRTGLEHFVEFAGENTFVRDAVESERVQQFKAHRKQQGAARETLNNDLGAVSILASYCLRRGWISERPVIKRFKPRIRVRYLEADQIRLYMANTRQPYRTLFQVLIGTGARLGEAEMLRVCDLRFNVTGGDAFIEEGKTEESTRTVFMPPWVCEALRNHVELYNLAGDDLLFRMPRRTAQKEHTRACKLAGIHRYTIHDHRHTFGVHMARSGMPLHLLQEQLGHARIETTLRYSRFHPAYSDVGHYYEDVAGRLGLTPHSAPHPRTQSHPAGAWESRNSL